MDTSINEVAAVKAAEFTPAAVSAWLRSELAKLDTAGLRNVSLSVDTRESNCVTMAGDPAHEYDFKCGHGESISEAFAALRVKLPSGAAKAAKNRAEAARLLAEADAMEAKQ